MNLTLTKEEIALIEQKRAEEKAKQEAMLKSYDHYKERTINRETERLSLNEEDAEKRKQTYEEIFNKLIHVSNDFKFDCERIEREHEYSLYDIDDNGCEIKRITDERGEVLWLDPKETFKLKTYYYNIKISYTGKRPEGHNYYITPVEQYSKYGHRVIGYKMKVNGTGIDSYGDRGLLSKPSSVHKKLVDICDNAFKQIEYRTAQEQSNKRIIERAKLEFSQYVGEQFQYGSTNEFIVTLGNGIKITFYGYEDSEGNIIFNNAKVGVPYRTIEVKDLIEGLKGVRGKE